MSSTFIHEGNQYQKIFKHGFWYLLPIFIQKASGFLLLPVYTAYLSPADYGILGSLETLGAVAIFIISLRIEAGFNRFYFLERNYGENHLVALYSTHFIFVVLWGAVATAFILLLGYLFIADLIDIAFFPLVLVAVVPKYFEQMGYFTQAMYRADLKTKTLNLVQSLLILLGIAFTLILLIYFNLGVLGKMGGAALAVILGFIVYIRIAWKAKLLILNFNKAMLIRSLKYSLPFIPAGIAMWINQLSDRLILAYYHPNSEVGLYSMSANIAFIAFLLVNAIRQVQSSIAMSALTENLESGKQKISGFLSVFTWGMVLFFLGIALFSKEVTLLLTESSFHSAYHLIWLLVLPYIVDGYRAVFYDILSFKNFTKLLSIGAVLSSFFNIALNFLFIPKFGQTAAAWSTFITYFFYCVWVITFAQRLEPVKINWKIVLPSVGYGFGLFMLYMLLESVYSQPGLNIQEILLKISLILAYILFTLGHQAIRQAFQRQLTTWKTL